METSNRVNKKNLPLIIALSLPIIMIIVLAAAIYLPGVNKKPAHNFLYATGGNTYYGQLKYTVSGEYLKENRVPPNPNDPYYKGVDQITNLYLYDVEKDSSTELTFDQASKYRLDPSTISDDGYKVERGNSNGDFIFGSGGGDYNSWFIKGHNRSKKLKLNVSTANYYDVQFLGWVK